MMDDLLQEMINPAPVHHDGARRRRLWTTVAIVGLAAIGATTLTTSAIFTDNDSASAAIETGTVDLAIGQSVPFEFTPQNFAPGDSRFVPLEVQSNGSLALRYSISYSAQVAPNGVTDPDLVPAPVVGDPRDVLELAVYAVAGEASCVAGGAGTDVALNRPDAVSVPWPGVVTPLVGDPLQGFQDGDRELTVDDRSDWLCFKVTLPIGAGNEYQDTGVTLGLTFNAEQTVNNA